MAFIPTLCQGYTRRQILEDTDNIRTFDKLRKVHTWMKVWNVQHPDDSGLGLLDWLWTRKKDPNRDTHLLTVFRNNVVIGLCDLETALAELFTDEELTTTF